MLEQIVKVERKVNLNESQIEEAIRDYVHKNLKDSNKYKIISVNVCGFPGSTFAYIHLEEKNG